MKIGSPEASPLSKLAETLEDGLSTNP